jgi:RNA polymerase sigma-70 factor, ECF subfamily
MKDFFLPPQSFDVDAVLPIAGAPARQEAADVRRVYVEHSAFLWRSLLRLGVREADVDDALQELLVVVHRKLPGFDPRRGHMKGWLFGIAVRVAHGHRRRAYVRREVPAESADCAAAPSTPEDDLRLARARRDLETVLAALSPVKRATFVMFELEGLSTDEIAAVTGVPVGTVHSRLHGARRDFERGLTRLRARDRGSRG